MVNGHMGHPSPLETDTLDWKHYLPTTSVVGGKMYVRMYSSVYLFVCSSVLNDTMQT